MIINRKIPLKFLLNEIKLPLFVVTLLETAFCLLPRYYSEYTPDVSIQIASTLGIAISILLSYKINQSYNRWWEVRTIWGSIANYSRTLILRLQLYLNNENEQLQKISYYQIAWNYALEKSLRNQDTWSSLEGLLNEEDIAEIKKHSNIPLAISQLQLKVVKVLFEKNLIDARLQNPFNNSPTDTPISPLSRTIEINIRQLLNETEIPKPIEAQGFYLM